MPRSAWNDVRNGRARTRSSNDQFSDDDHDDNDHRHHDGLGSESKRRSAAAAAAAGSAKVSSWDRVRKSEAGGDGIMNASSADGPSEFPRTREDLENRPSRHKNQYGDAM